MAYLWPLYLFEKLKERIHEDLISTEILPRTVDRHSIANLCAVFWGILWCGNKENNEVVAENAHGGVTWAVKNMKPLGRDIRDRPEMAIGKARQRYGWNEERWEVQRSADMKPSRAIRHRGERPSLAEMKLVCSNAATASMVVHSATFFHASRRCPAIKRSVGYAGAGILFVLFLSSSLPCHFTPIGLSLRKYLKPLF